MFGCVLVHFEFCRHFRHFQFVLRILCVCSIKRSMFNVYTSPKFKKIKVIIMIVGGFGTVLGQEVHNMTYSIQVWTYQESITSDTQTA
jgi:hypothetical protein